MGDRDKAKNLLNENNIRFRAGKTLVPFRLTGNIEWGVPSPVLEGEEGLTIWVWPESLWAPISFTKTYLKQQGKPDDEWEKFWLSKDAEVFQFIGQDNIYFYGIAEMAMFMATQGRDNLTAHPEEGQLTLPTLVANNHILFLNKKASSSGAVKPPMAEDLLEYYTAEQLRAHFLGLGLSLKSVSFQPKPLNPTAGERTQTLLSVREKCSPTCLTVWRAPASTQFRSTESRLCLWVTFQRRFCMTQRRLS